MADDDATPTRNGNRSPPNHSPPPGQIDLYETDRVKREIVLKWAFKSSDITEVQQAHASTLREIVRNFTESEVEIMSNRTGLAIKAREIDKIAVSIATYKNYFSVTSPPTWTTKEGKTTPRKYFIYHRIHSTLSLREIKQNCDVIDILQTTTCRFTEHLWNEDITDVKDIGWFVGYNPKYGMREQMEECVKRTISEKTKVREDKVPPFKIYKTAIFHMYQGNRYITYAYVLQCRTKQVKYLRRSLIAAYDKEAKFMFFEAKYHCPAEYATAIQVQRKHLNETSVVTIQGVSPAIMWSFDSYLKQKDPRIKHVLSTTRSQTEGRYNLITSRSNKNKVADDLEVKLGDFYRQFFREAPPTGPQQHDKNYLWPTVVTHRYGRFKAKGETASTDSSDSPSGSIRSLCTISFYSTCSAVHLMAPVEETTDSPLTSKSIRQSKPSGNPTPSGQTPLPTVTTIHPPPGLAPDSALTH